MTESLDVVLWDMKVGTLVASRKGYLSQICFYFDQDFVKSGLDIAPLRASVHGVVARNGLPVYPEEDRLFGGLPSFIADSMPDRWGNVVFDEWAKASGIRRKDLTALDRLAYIGRRGMGALEFVPPADCAAETPFKVEVGQLSDLAHKAMKEAKDFHAVLSPDLAIESLFKVGTSAGGRRPKAVINVNQESGECYSGQVATPLPGYVPMIIKFDEQGDVPTTRIEYSYWLMARDAGIEMTPSRLLECCEETHFLTERFDRTPDGRKIHVQTLAAMNPNSTSYEDLFEVAQRLGADQEEMRQLFLRMVMNVMAANVDDHNKNFSFLMDRDGVWRIAPAYDFTFAVDPSAPFYVNCHSMTVNGKNQGISRGDLLAVAARYSIKGAEGIIEKAMETAGRYRDYALKSGVPEPWIKKIESEIADRLEKSEPPA